MRIVIISIGSMGDVVPFIALGRGLKARGHSVVLATYGTFAERIGAAGLEPFPLSGDAVKLLRSAGWRRLADSGTRTISLILAQRHLMKRIAARARIILDECIEACRGSDLILYSATSLMGGSIGEAFGIPAIQAFMTPLTPTRRFPNYLSARVRPWQVGPWNLTGHLLLERMLGMTRTGILNEWRRQSLGLPPITRQGPLYDARRRRLPLLYGISPVVLPRPDDWGSWIHMTGYWFGETDPDWQPPPELSAFLDTGPQPISVGLGSATVQDVGALTAVVVEALQLAGRRAVILSGWGDLGGPHLPPDLVYRTDHVPHDWLFPRVAASVHAGGAGTTAASFRAGVPQVVLPVHADQFFWGRLGAVHGVAPAAVRAERITPRRLAGMIRAVTDDPRPAERARAIAARLAGEDGVATAADLIEDLAGQWPQAWER